MRVAWIFGGENDGKESRPATGGFDWCLQSSTRPNGRRTVFHNSRRERAKSFNGSSGKDGGTPEKNAPFLPAPRSGGYRHKQGLCTLLQNCPELRERSEGRKGRSSNSLLRTLGGAGSEAREKALGSIRNRRDQSGPESAQAQSL